METIALRILCIFIGYFFGLLQTSYLYGKIKNIDIRDFGSGNAGTTNAMRVLGKKAGLITFLGDVLKAIICTIVIYFIFINYYDKDFVFILRVYSGIGVILGHNFPFYMGFKGGKGIAAAGGVILGLGDIKIILIELAIFISIVAITRYVSLGSLMIMAGFLIEIIIFNEIGIVGFHNDMKFTGTERIEVYLMVFFIAALAWYKHRANIVRLLSGTENKIGSKKNTDSDEISNENLNEN
ncbi:acyl-phosphate glycerol-3-phosphate acyltransferase [Lachnospiraceae bacterium RM5]|nr:acyl-phosphate glycerol-3-phosphate acyltransferase [Lachnospiraceae bacterium RM5]